MATSIDKSVEPNLTSSNWSSVDIGDESLELELAASASPPMAVPEEEEDDLLDYDCEDDDDDSMISGDYTEDEDLPPESVERPVPSYSSVSEGDMNMLGLSELSDAEGESEEEEEGEETTKCCGKGALRKIKGVLIGFAKAAVSVIYKVYAMMTPKQKMVMAGAATAAVMSMVGIEKEETVSASEVGDDEAAGVTVSTDGEDEDEMTTTDVMKDVASDLIHVIMDTIDKTE